MKMPESGMYKSNIVFNLLSTILLSTGLLSNATAFSDGYILCGAYAGKTTFLLDSAMNVVTTWNHAKLSDSLNGYSVYLMPNGHLLRSGQVTPVYNGTTQISPPANAAPIQGTLDEIDACGNVVWSYQLADSVYMLHHDMKLMPNGNILAVTFVRYSRAQMIAAGVDSTIIYNGMPAKSMLGEKIVEIKPDYVNGGGAIVWEWVMFDHVAPEAEALENPGLISGSIVNSLVFGQWVHLNGIDFDSVRNLIVFTSRIFSELYVIDHSTTTEEAKVHTGGDHGKGGDILYRWGRSKNYLETGDTAIYVLHCPTWIPQGYPGAGNILFFHNNSNLASAEGTSQIVEIAPPMDANGKFICTPGVAFGPATPTWLYAPESDFCSILMSSTFRLPNGNTLIHEAYPTSQGGLSSNSKLREVDPNQAIVDSATLVIDSAGSSSGHGMAWNPAKIMYYPSTYIGIKNLLTEMEIGNRGDDARFAVKKLSPRVTIVAGVVEFADVSGCEIGLFDLSGAKIAALRPAADRFIYNLRRFAAGAYLLKITAKNGTVMSRRFTVLP